MYESDVSDVSDVSEVQWACEKLQEYDVLNNKHDKGYKCLLSVRKMFIQLLKSFVKQGWVDKLYEENIVLVERHRFSVDSLRKSFCSNPLIDDILHTKFRNSYGAHYMNINGEIVPIFAMTVGLIIVVTKTLTSTISKHKLDVERIKADAMVRAEEVRSRNELELEKLIRQDQNSNNAKNSAGQAEPDSDKKSTRERIRD
jgi:hypothetical protein